MPRYDIPGSLWLPDVGRGALSPELERSFRDHLEAATKGRRDTPVVFYCLADCWMSWNATKRAAEWGYTHLYWYRDGIDAWEAAKLPVAKADPAAPNLDRYCEAALCSARAHAPSLASSSTGASQA